MMKTMLLGLKYLKGATIVLLLIFTSTSFSWAQEIQNDDDILDLLPGILAASQLSTDDDGDGYTENQGDCRDDIYGVNPGATEVCGDGIDQDCDGVDEGCSSLVSIVGSWRNTTTENDLLFFSFLDDGTYIHAEVDFGDQNETSGMEWGTYSRDATTGQMTVTQTFDRNGDTGLTDFIGTPNLFANVSADILTLGFDDNGDDVIDGELSFDRQFNRVGFSSLTAGTYLSHVDGDLSPTTFVLNGDKTGLWSYGNEDGSITWDVSNDGVLTITFASGGFEEYTLTSGDTLSGTVRVYFSDEAEKNATWSKR